MQTYSCVKNHGGVPALHINGEPVPACAYMTYLEKNNRYEDFARAGYRLFSVPVLFSGRWISATAGFKPFKKGFFDEKGRPDFTPFDESMEKILAACPDAYVFPRVNITMPVWWENEHPDDVNILPDGTILRESFYSRAWLADSEKMLREFIRYVESSRFAPHIVGYQLAGGNTEEWFHYDLNGGLCPNAEKGFRAFLEEKYPGMPYAGLPDLSEMKKDGCYLHDGYLSAFLEYANHAVAQGITVLANAAKQECGGRVAIGTFYGYSLEVPSPLHGTHALKTLLADENIDFICSPNSYIGIREPGADWTEMYPAASVRLHGKACFQECDIRTHLTRFLHDTDPETDPLFRLNHSIWLGSDDPAVSRGMIKKAFSRQLINGNGFWWFDMWGGWYADETLMEDMKQMREAAALGLNDENRESVAQVAAFIDESAFRYLTDGPLRFCAFDLRCVIGLAGAPCDYYDISDFEAVHEKYKAVIFLSFAETEYMKRAKALCADYLGVSPEKPSFTVQELAGFYAGHGVHVYCGSGDIVYINRNFAALCAVTSGVKTVTLKQKRRVIPLLSQEKEGFISDRITVNARKGETYLFRITD